MPPPPPPPPMQCRRMDGWSLAKRKRNGTKTPQQQQGGHKMDATRKQISTLVGRTKGRKLRDWGHTGVRMTHCAQGLTMEPPALRLYAVDPVGVLTINLQRGVQCVV